MPLDKSEISWTDAARKQLQPRRRAPKPSKGKPETHFKKATKNWKAKPWSKGLGLNTPTIRRELKRVIESLKSDTPLKCDPGLLFCCLESSRELLDYYFATGHPEKALQALFSASRLSQGDADGIHLFRSEQSEFVDLKEWKHLRQLLLKCDDASYTQAKKWAGEQRTRLDIVQQCILSYLFPEEADWCHETVENFLLNPPTAQWGNWTPEVCWLMLYSLRDVELLGKLLDQFEHIPEWAPWPIVEIAGADAVRLLAPRAKKFTYKEMLQPMLKSLSLISTTEVGILFCELQKTKLSKSLKTLLGDYFLDHPRIAMEVLPGRDQSLLSAVVRQNQELAAEMLERLPEDSRKILERILKPLNSARSATLAENVPSILSSPPWRKKHKPKKPTVVKDVASLCSESRVDWRGRPEPKAYFYDRPPVRSTPKEVEKGLKWLSDDLPDINIFLIDRVPDEAALQFFAEQPGKVWSVWQDSLLPIVARFGTNAVGPLSKLMKSRGDLAAAAIGHIVDPRVAPALAQALDKKRSAGTARDWFERYPEVATHGLIPTAVGPTGSLRDSAERALRLLPIELVRSVVSAYEPTVQSAVEEVLAFDPLLILPKKLPKQPTFAAPPSLPQLLDNEGKALPERAVTEFLTMLSFSSLEEPYAGIDKLRTQLAPDPLAEFCWALFEAWMRAGSPSKEQWAFLSLGHYGDDETARRLTPLIRKWPGESGHQRAVIGLEVLCQIGTDVALMNLHGIAQKLPYKGLQKKAKEKIDKLAAKRGLSADGLADRLVPDFDLDQKGSLWLDFGPRRFEVRLDQQLNPKLFAEQKLIKSLPKPNKADNAELAAAAKKRFSGLKKDLKTVAKSQLVRLERAMTMQRRWSAETFQQFLVAPPLIFTLTQRLIWGVYKGDEFVSAFRVAEDRSLANLEDETFDLATDAVVGIVHPLELPDKEKAGWTEALEDYELLQPFLQLQREVFKSENRADQLKKYTGQPRPFSRLLALEDRGWKRGDAYDGGVAVHLEKSPAGFYLELQFEPGLYLGSLRESGDQTVERLLLRPGPDSARELAWNELPPIAWSELLLDLESLL